MKETILVVEDEASIRNITRVYLEQELNNAAQV